LGRGSELVSVVMPAFNAEDTINGAIDSVLNQTYSNIELIIVDDASTDCTFDKVSAYTDPRVILVSHMQNKGEGAARNTAINLAQGRWISLIDADDVWVKNRLTKLLGICNQDDKCVIADNVMPFFSTKNGREYIKPLFSKNELGVHGSIQTLKLVDYLQLNRMLLQPIYPTNILRENGIEHSNLTFASDTEFLINVLHTGAKLKILNEPLYLYRLTPGSATDNTTWPSIMRGMFEGLLENHDFNNQEKEAIKHRINRLKDRERYSNFLSALRQKSIKKMMLSATDDPWVLYYFMRHIFGTIKYRGYIAYKGGVSR
jgi:glycosyltransferase involved in cell wall biosynthesis